MKGIAWILLSISAAINVLLIFFYTITQDQLDRYENHPKVEYVDAGICISEKLLSNGNIIGEYCDFDDDRIYDEINVYNKEGALLARHFDLNNNLVAEVSFLFNADGKVYAKSLDRDENGWPEILIEYGKQGKPQVIFHDANQNHFFEENEILSFPYSVSNPLKSDPIRN